MADKSEIVITGFPKCGTTALIRAFETDSDFHVVYSKNGGRDVSWPEFKEWEGDFPESGIRAHKFTAYIYNQPTLEYLARSNPRMIAVLCIRDLEKALISWHRMHQSIAKSGQNPNHFAYKERDFYQDCTIPDYYQHLAKRRLQYGSYLLQLIAAFGVDRIVIVSQERMAQDITSVVAYLKDLSVGKVTFPPKPPLKDEKYESYADRADYKLPVKIRNELMRFTESLADVINENNIRCCV